MNKRKKELKEEYELSTIQVLRYPKLKKRKPKILWEGTIRGDPNNPFKDMGEDQPSTDEYELAKGCLALFILVSAIFTTLIYIFIYR